MKKVNVANCSLTFSALAESFQSSLGSSLSKIVNFTRKNKCENSAYELSIDMLSVYGRQPLPGTKHHRPQGMPHWRKYWLNYEKSINCRVEESSPGCKDNMLEL